MEKRDLIVIVIAVFIVLVMAMYIKPLVTGKQVQLIPDELAALLKGDNQSQVTNNTVPSNVTPPKKRVIPSLNSITPDSLTSYNNSSTVIIEGSNLTGSMNITFMKDGINQTFKTEKGNGTLIAHNVSLPEGNWTIKIVDSSGKGVTYNTTRTLNVFPPVTPVPTWDGKPLPLKITEKPKEPLFQTRPYPEDPVINKTPMKIYSNFSGISSVSTAPVYIPSGYWDLIYTVDFTTNIANPKDTTDNVFEFNKQYKEPLVTYEGAPIIYYPKNGSIPDMVAVKEKVESKTDFRPSSEKVLTKKPAKERDASSPFDTTVTDYTGQALVESVGYLKPDITIKIKNTDLPDSPEIIVKPEGGIDPLQWNEAKHKAEAETIMIQQGKKEIFDSEMYKDEWTRYWKLVKDPRPWTQRIYGPGNYSLVIDTQSLDSYNIRITVPDVMNRTQAMPSEGDYEVQNQLIREVMDGFVKSFNKKIDSDYYSSISRYLTADQKSTEQVNTMYRELSQARASGYYIDDIAINDILVQGNVATVRGELSVLYNGYVKKVPLDISLVHEESGWKIQNIPEMR